VRLDRAGGPFMVSKEPPSWEITLRKKQSKVYLRGQGKNLTHIIKKTSSPLQFTFD